MTLPSDGLLPFLKLFFDKRAQDARTVDLIVFPELSLPLKSIGTLARFVRQTKTLVLAGLELRASTDGSRSLNELIMIVPMERDGESVAILTQEKIHITQGERGFDSSRSRSQPSHNLEDRVRTATSGSDQLL